MKIHKFIITIIGFSGLVSCSTWQEKQIDAETVDVFIPQDSLHTDIATQLFYWYHVEGADKYELQIVTPSFDQIDRLVLDTNVSDNKFEFTLQPGTYEWSIRAYNFSSTTGYTVYRLYIDSTLDLNNQKIVLNSPKDRDTTNVLSRQFSWQKLYNAENYVLEIYQPSVSGQLVYSYTSPNNSDSYNFTQEGSFEWRVRGINSSSQTTFSSREFYLDTTAPASPILKTPAKGVFLSPGNVSFEWTKSNTTGSSIFDTLYVATDSNLVNLRRKVYSRNNRGVGDTLSAGIYYWRVRSFDKAGNVGSFSSSRQFTIQ